MATKRIANVASHLTAATVEEPEASQDEPVWELGIYGGGGEGAERGIMKMYEYGPEGKAMPDVTVTCVNKELLVEADPPDWKPEDGYEPARHPVYQITFANPEGPDYAGNTDFETIGCCIDRGDAVKFHFDHGAKAFSVCAERPGSFDICAKICAQPHCAAHPPVQDLCKANQRAPWQTRTAAPPATWSTWRSAKRSTASSTGRASAPAASAARARTWL